MGYIVSLILLIFAIVQHIRRKTFAAPEVFFCYEWAFISLLASLRLFTLYEVSIYTWAVILLGCLFFVFGSCVGQLFRRKKGLSKKRVTVKKRTFLLLFLVLLFLQLRGLIPAVKLLMQGYSLDSIRLASYNIIEVVGYSQSSWLDEWLDILQTVLGVFLIGYGIENFLFDYKKNKPFLFAAIIIVAISAFSDGGRFIIAYFVLQFIICYCLYKKEGRISINNNRGSLQKIIVWVSIGALCFMLLITVLRGSTLDQVASKYYRYACGDVVLLDHHIQRLDDNNIRSFTYGGLYGMWSTVLPFFHNLFGLPYPAGYLEAIDTVMVGQTFVKVGDALDSNAFLTSFYYLYADLGLFGVAFGMFAFGCICGYAYKIASFSGNSVYTVIYLYFSQMIFKTLQNYFLTSASYFVAVLIILILFAKKDKCRKFGFIRQTMLIERRLNEDCNY